MKILYLVTKSEEGGAQTHVYQLSRYFISQGHEVAVMSYPGGWLENEVKKLGGKFYANQFFSNSLNPFNFLYSMNRVQTIVDDFKPDIVHCHSSIAGLLGRMVIKNCIPTLYTAHGWGFNIGVPFIQKQLAIWGEKFVAKYCVKIICVSKFVKNLAVKYQIAKEDKFELVYNGVETDRQFEYRNDNKIKIVFVGRLAPPKQPLMLLQAVKDLPDELKNNLEVLIIGSGPSKIEAEEFIKNNQLQIVQMLGNLNRQAVLKVLCQSDIFVLLSQWEGLPLSVLEAMSVGLPVIASDVGGLSEVVNGNNGFLVRDYNHFFAILKNLVENKDMRKKIGDAARLSIVENYSVEKMLSSTEKVYNDVMKK